MKEYKAYLVDLDGTMYRGDKKIDGAAEFIQSVIDRQLPFMFLTNNSAKTLDQVAGKLNNMGIQAKEDQIYTSSLATAEYIRSEKENARIYVIGEQGLYRALENEGLSIVDGQADYVVIGIDREINYEKLTKACLEVRNGATLVSTNGDIAIPTERGMVPGNGALTSVVTVSTGVEPISVGKPESLIMDRALKHLGFGKEDVLMVGDNYNTDIRAGIQTGMDTLMVETGISLFCDIEKDDRQPTYKCKNLYDWMENH